MILPALGRRLERFLRAHRGLAFCAPCVALCHRCQRPAAWLAVERPAA